MCSHQIKFTQTVVPITFIKIHFIVVNSNADLFAMLTFGGGAVERARDMPVARKITRAWTRILLILLTATERVTSNIVILTLSIYIEAVICSTT